jgi:hypothetical protein
MSDITIHINETLDAKRMQDLEHDISMLGGIDEVCCNHQHPHLMVVKYDHEKMNSAAILSSFFDHGLNAELIGF